jgi:hypothetical protein
VTHRDRLFLALPECVKELVQRIELYPTAEVEDCSTFPNHTPNSSTLTFAKNTTLLKKKKKKEDIQNF